jgi:Ca2+-binding RTX toxin-like protein
MALMMHAGKAVLHTLRCRCLVGKLMRKLFISACLGTGLSMVLATTSMAAVIRGTPGNDRLIGTPSADTIYGLGGDDRIHGRGRADTLYAGAGRDRVFGEFGRDWIYGKGDADKLVGGLGRDHLFGGRGADTLWVAGDARSDVARCGAGLDTVYYDGNDFVAGNCENKIKVSP